MVVFVLVVAFQGIPFLIDIAVHCISNYMDIFSNVISSCSSDYNRLYCITHFGLAYGHYTQHCRIWSYVVQCHRLWFTIIVLTKVHALNPLQWPTDGKTWNNENNKTFFEKMANHFYSTTIFESIFPLFMTICIRHCRMSIKIITMIADKFYCHRINDSGYCGLKLLRFLSGKNDAFQSYPSCFFVWIRAMQLNFTKWYFSAGQTFLSTAY